MKSNQVLTTVAVLLLLAVNYCMAAEEQVEDDKQLFGSKMLRDAVQSTDVLQVIITVVTNAFSLPLVVLTLRKQLYPECVVACMLFVTSTMYHVGEVLNMKFWGMNHGQWHRLDNVFIILSVQNVFFYLFTPTSVTHVRLRPNQTLITSEDEAFIDREKRHLDFVRWLALIHVLLCQEKAPWNEYYTFLPIILIVAYTFIRLLLFIPSHYRPRYNRKYLALGGVMFLSGVVFFVLGLDDKNDYLRMKHALWHCLAGISVMLFFHSKRDSKRLMHQMNQRNRDHKKVNTNVTPLAIYDPSALKSAYRRKQNAYPDSLQL